jgi:hypothetical protein
MTQWIFLEIVLSLTILSGSIFTIYVYTLLRLKLARTLSMYQKPSSSFKVCRRIAILTEFVVEDFIVLMRRVSRRFMGD